jgi:YD repeat-containing protein
LASGIFKFHALNRVTNRVDAAGTTKYAYTAGGQLWTEDGPWSNDTVTNLYTSRLRTGLSLAQPTGKWTNSFGYGLNLYAPTKTRHVPRK